VNRLSQSLLDIKPARPWSGFGLVAPGLWASALLLMATVPTARAQGPAAASAATAAGTVKPAADAAAKVLLPGDNLVVEGIPPIAKELQERAGRYTEFRGASFIDWHPKQRQMIINTRFADTAQLHSVLFPGAARTQLTFFPDRVGDAHYQPVTADNFIFSKDIGGGEWFQLYRFDVKTGDITLLTDGKSRNTGPHYSHAGNRISYMSTSRNGRDTDLWMMDPQDKSTAKLVLQLSGGGWEAGQFSSDDKQLVLGEQVSATETYLWLVDVAKGEKTELTPRPAAGAEKVAYGSGLFSKDGKGLYVTTDKESEFQRLTYIDLATKKHTYLTTAIPWDIEEMTLSRDGRTLVFAANENGISRLYVMDTATKKFRPLPQVPVGVIGGLDLHSNGVDVGFTLSAARQSADAYSLNLKTGKVERWTQSETGGLRPETFSEPKLVTWKGLDGRDISGFLYLPPEKFTGKRPIMVNIHGGPEAQYRPGFLGRNNYYLNELGVALLFPNVRGSTGYGKTFLKLDDGFKREDSYRDAEALYKWIKQQPQLDGERILVTGGSYGGHMTLVSATHHNDLIRASLAVVGMSNLVTFLERTEGYRRDLRRVEYGDERDPKMRDFLQGIAPLNRAKNITKPLFIVQGQNDPRVPASEAEQMIRTVRQSKVPAWYLLAKDEGHGFAKKKNQDFQFYATILYLQQYLLK